jgi:S-formylglutathione hydrolase FrmB
VVSIDCSRAGRNRPTTKEIRERGAATLAGALRPRGFAARFAAEFDAPFGHRRALVPTPMNRRHALLALPGLGSLGIAGGCAMFTPEPVAPMPVRRDEVGGAAAAKTLLVLLPGAFDHADDFATEGFMRALDAAGAAVQVARPEAHLGYYVWESFVQRLHEDVVLPARGRGQRIWLAGISIGGYGALTYAMRHGAEVAGVLAIAPWLGRRELQRDILAAGGAIAWRNAMRSVGDQGRHIDQAARTEPTAPAEDVDRALWLWLGDAPSPNLQRPPLYLGFGTDDRLVGSHEAMAALLPGERVDRVPGGHDWPAWRLAWTHWLARGLLRA